MSSDSGDELNFSPAAEAPILANSSGAGGGRRTLTATGYSDGSGGNGWSGASGSGDSYSVLNQHLKDLAITALDQSLFKDYTYVQL